MNFAVLEKMNQLTEFIGVDAKGVRRIIAGRAKPAGFAKSLIIERRSIKERRPATRAIELCFERRRPGEAGPANGNPGEFPQRAGTDPAVIRENERKEVSGDLSNR